MSSVTGVHPEFWRRRAAALTRVITLGRRRGALPRTCPHTAPSGEIASMSTSACMQACAFVTRHAEGANAASLTRKSLPTSCWQPRACTRARLRARSRTTRSERTRIVRRKHLRAERAARFAAWRAHTSRLRARSRILLRQQRAVAARAAAPASSSRPAHLRQPRRRRRARAAGRPLKVCNVISF